MLRVKEYLSLIVDRRKQLIVGEESSQSHLKPCDRRRRLNQTEREVLIQRMGVEHFVQEAELRPVDSFRDSTLLKVNTAEKRGRHTIEGWREEPLALAFLKVVCPSTQKNYFLRVTPDVENAKQALESTLPQYNRDWERDLVTET